MLGRAEPQRSLWEAGQRHGHLLSAGSFYRFVDEKGHQLASDEDFSACYCLDNGRPSHPPSFMVKLMLLQAHDGRAPSISPGACGRWRAAATRKLIVETSLKAFGVPIESIIETAVAEIQALHGCIQSGAADMQRLLEDSQKRIASLEEQVTQIREVMDARKQEQSTLESQARARGLSVQQILEFFGQERVGQVVQDSPRLESPAPEPAKGKSGSR